MKKRGRADLGKLVTEHRLREAEIFDQIGRLISWRLRRIHSGGAWHDLHQECLMACIRWLHSEIAIAGKASTSICNIVDGVVMRAKKCQTLNTWDCTIEAAERMGAALVKGRECSEFTHRDSSKANGNGSQTNGRTGIPRLGTP